MAVDPLFEQYILKRGLIQPGVEFRKETIYQDPDMLSAAAGIMRGSKHVIEAVLQARIGAIEHELITEATPYEVLFLRQGMLEVAMVLDDLEAYAAEFERRGKKEDSAIEEGLSPPVGALPPDNLTEDNGEESSM